MRWKARPLKPSPEPGDLRVVKKFAWLPTRIDGCRVWLERYTQVEKLIWSWTHIEGAKFKVLRWIPVETFMGWE